MKHFIRIVTALFILIGIPLYLSGYPERLLSGGADTVTSASVVIERPSGEYVVLINKGLHKDKEKLETWDTFFKGEEITWLFEDISCTVAENDSAGYDIALSFMSRLPENQMKLRKEDAVLMLSKAEYGRFDVILMSKELADIYSLDTFNANDDIEFISGGSI